jgi:hypothetical protein
LRGCINDSDRQGQPNGYMVGAFERAQESECEKMSKATGRINSICKGKNFEREAAKLLTALTGKEWRRVPSSGAMAMALALAKGRREKRR